MVRFLLVAIFFVSFLGLHFSASADEAGPSMRTKMLDFFTKVESRCDKKNSTANSFSEINSTLLCEYALHIPSETVTQLQARDQAENSFFKFVGQEQIKEVACEAKLVNDLDIEPSYGGNKLPHLGKLNSLYPGLKLKHPKRNREASARRLQQTILNDIKSKLPEMRRLKSEMRDLNLKLSDYRTSRCFENQSSCDEFKSVALAGNSLSPEEFKRLDEYSKKLEQQYEAHVNSIYNSHTPEMRDYVEDLVSMENYNQETFVGQALNSNSEYYFQRQVVNKIKASANEQLAVFADYNHDYPDNFKLNATQRGMADHYVATLEKDTGIDYSRLQCQLEGRYGKNRKVAGDTVFWGGQAVMFGLTMGSSLWAQALGNLGRTAIMSSGAARTMRTLKVPTETYQKIIRGAEVSRPAVLAAGTLAIAGGLDAINASLSECFDANNLDGFRKGRCESEDPLELDMLKDNLAANNCALGLVVSATATALGPGLAVAKKLGAKYNSILTGKIKGNTNKWRATGVPNRLSLEKTMNRQKAKYLMAKQEGHPEIANLERLGFEFTKDGVKVPELGNILNSLDIQIDDLVRRGVLEADQVLRPAIPYHNPAKDPSIVFFRPGMKLDPSYKPYEGVLTPDQFREVVSSGLFPVAPPGLVTTTTGSSIFIHDLQHFGGFLDNPEFMREFRGAYTRLDSLASNSTANNRLIQISEALERPSPEVIADVNQVLRDYNLQIGDPRGVGSELSVSQIRRALERAVQGENANQLSQQLMDRIIATNAGSRSSIGGNIRDPLLLQNQRRDGRLRLPGYLSEMENAMRMQVNPRTQNAMDSNDRISSLSIYLATLDRSSRVSIREWFGTVTQNNPVPNNTRIHRLICSGEYRLASYDVFCPGR